MMTLEEFIKKYKNGVDYDGMYGKQCVDYVNQYAKEVLGIKGAFYGQGIRYAYQVFVNYDNFPYVKEHFTRIANAKTNYPLKGDVIVWAKERNTYAGHIAVVLSATEHTITVAEQNYDGNGGVRTYTYPNYNHVLGWLRAKDVKHNRPTLSPGQVITLKKRAYLFCYDNSKSGIKALGDCSDFYGEAILKAGAKVKVGKISVKANKNIWVYIEKYGGWICVYNHQNDNSKV